MTQEKLKQVADKLGASLMKGFGCNQYLVFGDPTNPEKLFGEWNEDQCVRFPRLTKAWSYSDQFVTRYRCFSPTSSVSGFTRIAMIDLLRQPTPDLPGGDANILHQGLHYL